MILGLIGLLFIPVLVGYQLLRAFRINRLSRLPNREEVELVFATADTFNSPHMLIIPIIQLAGGGLALGILIDSVLFYLIM